MRMNERLTETEKELEQSLQGKQGVSTSQPPETTPISTTAPSTVTTTIPSTAPASTTGTSAADTLEATTTIVSDTSMSMQNMVEEIKALELQMAELK